MQWRTSSYTNGGNGAQCVECGHTGSGERFAIRDSKNRTGPALSFSPEAFRAFLDHARTAR